jgi:hypothetical protein
VETANGFSSGRTSAINHIIAPGFDVSDAHLYQTIKIDNQQAITHPLVKKVKTIPIDFNSSSGTTPVS